MLRNCVQVVKKPGRKKKKDDMSEDESGEGSASSADEDPVDQDEDSQADLNASMQEMNVQQVFTGARTWTPNPKSI